MNQINIFENLSEKTNNTFITKKYKTVAPLTERTVLIADAFGLAIDDERTFNVFDDIYIEDDDSNVVFITGDSGGGKSTLIRCYCNKYNVKDINEIEIDKNEIVIESVGKNLNDAVKILNVCGLTDAFIYLRRYGELSDGQKYRYRIAKMINEKKDVWIFDEFCANLDRITARLLAFKLQKLARKMNKKLIVATTHDDFINELKPDLIVEKNYESDINITKRKENDYDNELFVYKHLEIKKGDTKDYKKLHKFHYRGGDPAGVKNVFCLYYKKELVGVLLTTYPPLQLKARNKFTDEYKGSGTTELTTKTNNEVEHIARVVIIPKYRGIGLGYYLVKNIFGLLDVKYIETMSVMSNYNPFFEKAGMQRVNIDNSDKDSTREQYIAQIDKYIKSSVFSSKTLVKRQFDALGEQIQHDIINSCVEILFRIDQIRVNNNFNKKSKSEIKQIFTNNKDMLFDFFRHLKRANTVYYIKKL